MQQFLPHLEAWAPHPFIPFFERQRGDGGEKDLLVYFPKNPQLPGLEAKPKLGTRNSIQVFPVSGKDPTT